MSRGPALGSVLILTGAALAAYLRFLRPWQLRWGATDAEVSLPLPGDEVVARPTFDATRAVTVDAPPAAIWPWLVQIGCNRAGWYSYDLLDNLGRPSADRIIPELQQMAVGDIVPMSPDGKQGHWVKALEANRWMLWGDRQGAVTWFWGLHPLDEKRTRLVTRVRIRYDWKSPWILFNLLLDVGDIVMMRKCMLGIKARAEKLALAS